MKTKLISIIAIVVAVLLLALGCVLGFDRASDIGGSYVMNVEINEAYNIEDIEAIMKEAGAVSANVQQNYNQLNSGKFKAGEVATIYFEIEEGADAATVFNKAEELLGEKYFLKFPGELSSVTATTDVQNVISMWPALVVTVIALAYVFIRFGVKMGLTALVDMFVALAAAIGIIGVAGIKFTGYTIPALLLTGALAFVFAVVFAFMLKANSIGKSADEAYADTVKMTGKLAAVLLAILAIAFVVMLVMGNTMLQSFALTAIIGIALNAIIALFVLPSMAK